MHTTWTEASRRQPCPICGHGSWCRFPADQSVVWCRRVPDGGEARIDRAGVPYYLHRLAPGTLPRPADWPVQARPEPAPVELRDTIYRAFLARLDLSQRHRANLRGRGLSDAEADRRGYRTLPAAGRPRIVRDLLGRFAADDLAGVPGFRFVRGTDGRSWWTVAGSVGMLIPVRDLAGRIGAMQIRRDDGDDGPRYLWLSSRSHGGPGPGTPCHAPLPAVDGRHPAIVRLTEGPLKGDVATALDPERILTVAVPGTPTWRAALPVLSALAPARVRLAFDADAWTNPHVARDLVAAAAGIEAAGFNLEIERWHGAKGIDDLFAARASIGVNHAA